MSELIAFLIGLFVGGTFGVLVLSLVAISAAKDPYYDDIFVENKEEIDKED